MHVRASYRLPFPPTERRNSQLTTNFKRKANMDWKRRSQKHTRGKDLLAFQNKIRVLPYSVDRERNSWNVTEIKKKIA